MKKLYLLKTMLLLCALIVGGVSSWAKDITVTMKSYAGATSSGYVNSDTKAEISDVTFYACGYNPGNGQLRGNKTAIAATNNGNFHIYNSTAVPGVITKIVLKHTATGSNKFQNNMYAATGTTSQSAVSSIAGLTKGTLASDGSSFTWTFSKDAGITYFKLCSTEKFTSGSVTGGQIVITYEEDTATATTTTISATGITNTDVKAGASAGQMTASVTAGGSAVAGATVTWKSSNESVATIDTEGNVTLVAEGTTTITATYAGDASYKGSDDTYELTVSDSRTAPGLAWSSTEDVLIAKGATESEYTLPTLTNTNSVSPIIYAIEGTDDLAVEVDGAIVVDTDVLGTVTVTASFAGNATYKATSTSYKITVYQPVVFEPFYESFDDCAGTAGNDNKSWSGSVANGTYVANNSWTVSNSYGAYMSAKFGASSRQGIATTPELKMNPSTTYVLTFKAGAWDGGSENTSLILESEDAIFHGETSTTVTMVKGKFTGYYMELTNGSATTTVSFKGKEASSSRFFLDEVRIVEKSSYPATDTKNVTSNGWATYIPTYNVQFADGDAYVVTDVNTTTGAVTIESVTKVPVNTPVLLKGAGEKTITVLTDATVAVPSTNMLMISNGTNLSTEYPYVLAKNGDAAGFKQWTGAMSSLKGRAILPLDNKISSAREFFFIEDETTGIKNVNRKVDNNNCNFNLAGQRVAQPTKGLYIVNGKKVAIK